MLGDGDAEIQFLVTFVRLRFAQIPRGAAAPDEHAGKTQRPCVVERHNPDVDVSLFEDAIVCKQDFEIVADFQEWVAERVDVLEKLLGQILVNAANTEIVGVHARARGALIENHQLFSLFETP